MRRVAMLAILIAGLALPAPSVFAHGNQFICARVTIGDDGHVALELTADYSDNPNIADATEARQVLRDCLQVGFGDRFVLLEQVAPLHFSERDQYSADSPIPPAAEPGPHRLVVASWTARMPGQRVVFAAKERTPLDMVMWQARESCALEPKHWMLLIAGDRSPEFATTVAAASSSMPIQIMASLFAFPLLTLLIRTLTGRRLVKVGSRVPE